MPAGFGQKNYWPGSVWLTEGQTSSDGDILGMAFFVEGITGDIPQ